MGRQGADNFRHGIAILTTADYYALGNRADSFLKLAPDVARFEEYRTPVIRCLADAKLVHWDVRIRALASQSLARVSKLDPRYAAAEVLPKLLDRCLCDDLVVRHGSLLGVAEIVLAFGEADLVRGGEVLDDDAKSRIAELVPSIENARLYRGRGGEVMRSAACRAIECISLAGVPLTVKQQASAESRFAIFIGLAFVAPNSHSRSPTAFRSDSWIPWMPVWCTPTKTSRRARRKRRRARSRSSPLPPPPPTGSLPRMAPRGAAPLP